MTATPSLSREPNGAEGTSPSLIRDPRTRPRGRTHTFTEVANFGGGKVPPLSKGLITAPECPGSMDIPPGGSTTLSSLAPGNHRFQCCIHPWMRALIKVKPHGEQGDS